MDINLVSDPADTILLQGVRAPGIVVVRDGKLKLDWQIMKAWGLTGAASLFRGRDLSKVVISIELWNDADWDDWNEFKKILALPERGRPKAIQIEHPSLAEIGITQVALVEWPVAKQTSPGVWTYTLTFIEYRKYKLALAKLDGAKATEKPLSATDQKIKELREQAKAAEGLLGALATDDS